MKTHPHTPQQTLGTQAAPAPARATALPSLLAMLALAGVFSSYAKLTTSGGASERGVLLAIAAASVLVALARAPWQGALRGLAVHVGMGIGFVTTAWLGLTTMGVWHELPEHVVRIAAEVFSLLGKDASVVRPGILAVDSAAGPMNVAISAERLGPCMLLAVFFWSLAAAARLSSFVRALAFVALAWILTCGYALARLPVLLSIEQGTGWMGVYWTPLSEFVSFVPLTFALYALLRGFMPESAGVQARTTSSAGVSMGWASIAGVLALLSTFAVWLEPPGERRQQGVVMIDEAHSDWSWASGRFDETSFGQRQTYTYASLVRLWEHFATVRVNIKDDTFTDELLKDVSVLVLKMPTRAYDPGEIDVVERFVRRGGGLFLVGDHTNLFGNSTYLNPLASRFGIRFESDSQFELGTGRPTAIASSPLSPMILRARGMEPVAPLTFLTGCTLRAPAGRATLVGFGMTSEPAEYSHVNFFGNIRTDRDERWGTFVQMASVRVGAGRVMAYSDSTAFSDFCLYDDGKAALAVRTLDLLHRDRSAGMNRALSFLHAAAGWLWILTAFVIAYAASRVWWSALVAALCAVLGFAVASHASQPGELQPQTPVTHVRIREELGTAQYPGFLDWSPAVTGSPRAYDQFALCFLRQGLAPIRNDTFPTGGPPQAEVLVLPDAGRWTAQTLQAIVDRVKSGITTIVLVDNATNPQQVTTQVLLNAMGVTHRPVRIPRPSMPPILGETHDEATARAKQEEAVKDVVRFELTKPTDAIVLPVSGVWIQTVQVGAGRLVLVDGSFALSRRGSGMVFKVQDARELALARMMMALQRYALDPAAHREALLHAARAAEEAWVVKPIAMPDPQQPRGETPPHDTHVHPSPPAAGTSEPLVRKK